MKKKTVRKNTPPFTLNFDKLSVHRYIPLYLMACYAYYCLSDPILTDESHDKLCLMIQKYWDDIEHPHKNLVNVDDMKSSTGNELKSFYPSMVKNATEHLLEEGEIICQDVEHTPEYIDDKYSSLEQFFV